MRERPLWDDHGMHLLACEPQVNELFDDGERKAVFNETSNGGFR